MASWRNVLAIHPAAELFPRMSAVELAALAEDIKANGLKSPIVLWVPGSPDDYPNDSNPPQYVLDGINRLDAMERAGLELVTDEDPTDPFTTRFDGCTRIKYEKQPLSTDEQSRRDKGEHVEPQPDTDPYAYVISANIHRRHLKPEQKRDLIGKLIKADPSKSDRQIGKMIKADNKTVASVRAEKEAREEIPHVSTRTDSKGRQQPARKTNKAERKPKFVSDGEPGLNCSFCGKSQHEVDALITNGKPQPFYICNECVDECVGILKQKKAATASREATPPTDNGIPDFLDRTKGHWAARAETAR